MISKGCSETDVASHFWLLEGAPEPKPTTYWPQGLSAPDAVACGGFRAGTLTGG